MLLSIKYLMYVAWKRWRVKDKCTATVIRDAQSNLSDPLSLLINALSYLKPIKQKVCG